MLLLGTVGCSDPLAPEAIAGHYVAAADALAPVITETATWELLLSTVVIDAREVALRTVLRQTSAQTGEVRLWDATQRMSYVLDGRRIRTGPPRCRSVPCPTVNAVGLGTPDFLAMGDQLVTVDRGGHGITYERQATSHFQPLP